MNDVNAEADRQQIQWRIDTDWFKQNNRSLSTLVEECLCPDCRHKYNSSGKPVTTEKLMKSVHDCCSKVPDFVNLQMPILESVFRLFLATANTPMTVDAIMRELGERWEVSVYRIPADMLFSLLNGDRYYGINQFQG